MEKDYLTEYDFEESFDDDYNDDGDTEDFEESSWYESYNEYMKDATNIMKFLTPDQLSVVVEAAIMNGYGGETVDDAFTEAFPSFGRHARQESSVHKYMRTNVANKDLRTIKPGENKKGNEQEKLPKICLVFGPGRPTSESFVLGRKYGITSEKDMHKFRIVANKLKDRLLGGEKPTTTIVPFCFHAVYEAETGIKTSGSMFPGKNKDIKDDATFMKCQQVAVGIKEWLLYWIDRENKTHAKVMK